MSPRRSSRARTTQPSNGPDQASSSSSSTTSVRPDRSTRSIYKNGSPTKSATPGSHSSVEPEDSIATVGGDLPHTRRRRRDQPDDDDLPLRHVSRSKMDDVEPAAVPGLGHGPDDGDEEEVTRCVCGQQEYPGLPPSLVAESKALLKRESDQTPPIASVDALPEDAGGLFIQCDICKVWQHGGCVGIMDESMSPDEYFCELCRKDLHRVTVGPNGQRSSRYLPVLEDFSPRPSRATSQPKDAEPKSASTKASRAAAALDGGSGKRRSTMNSRDAAYDEEEQLRRAIEESKAEKAAAKADAINRKGKRSRGESEEIRQNSVKRQRTTSGTPSSPPNPNRHSASLAAESDNEDGNNRGSGNGASKRIRGAAARNHRERELRERDKDKDRERADAAGRRKGRVERRKGDDSDPSDEYPQSHTASVRDGPDSASQPPEPPQSSQPPPDTPPSTTQNAQSSSSHRRTGRPPTRRGRVGRNQYTRDRDLRTEPGDGDASRDPSRSRDGGRRDDTNGAMASSHLGGESSRPSRPSRPRYMHPQRTTMNEMKRRVAAILEFISRTQIEMAGDGTPPSGTDTASATASMLRNFAEGLPMITVNGGGDKEAGTKSAAPPLGDKEFAELSSLEMMDVLTRKLVLWQKDFGKWGEK